MAGDPILVEVVNMGTDPVVVDVADVGTDPVMVDVSELGIQGPPGPQGIQGPQGLPGATGPQGEPGTGGGVESTYTPTIKFGGNAVGITYSSQKGEVLTIGHWVLFHADLTLTSKGTSTGDLYVSLPSTARSQFISTYHATVLLFNFTAPANVAEYSVVYPYNSTVARVVYRNTSGIDANVTNAHITDTSRLSIAGMYLAFPA
jgi:hypothetical protein